tara:strand:+ start:734 stop:985 length:252 start_codon:yes stop_codon:yes gene_type:complete
MLTYTLKYVSKIHDSQEHTNLSMKEIINLMERLLINNHEVDKKLSRNVVFNLHSRKEKADKFLSKIFVVSKVNSKNVLVSYVT